MTGLNHRLRRLLASAGFLAGLAVLLWGLHILTVPYYTVAASWSQYRALEAGTLDVLIVGNSHAYTSTAPFQIWDEQGITSWHVGGSSINARMKRAYVEQAFAYHRPKVLALEVNRMDQTRIQEDQVNYWAYTHMPRGLSRTMGILDTAAPRKWDRFLFPLIGEHHRYDDLFPYSIVRNAGLKEDPTTGGATVLYTAPPPEGDRAAQRDAAAGGGGKKTESERDQLFQYNVEEIRRIAELCQQNGVRLMLWLAPVQGNYTVGKDPLPLIRAQLSGDFPDTVYLNTNLHQEKIGLVDDDFRDSGHLYSWGMKRATSFMARQLAESYSGIVGVGHSAQTIERWDSWAGQWNPPSTLQPAPAE